MGLLADRGIEKDWGCSELGYLKRFPHPIQILLSSSFIIQNVIGSPNLIDLRQSTQLW